MLPAKDFSPFEKSILLWIREHYQNLALRAQIDAATFKQRKWTGVGYYVDFDVPRTLQPADVNRRVWDRGYQTRSWPINGPTLPESTEIEYGGKTWLWGENGYIHQLEMVCHGDNFAEDPSLCGLLESELDE